MSLNSYKYKFTSKNSIILQISLPINLKCNTPIPFDVHCGEPDCCQPKEHPLQTNHVTLWQTVSYSERSRNDISSISVQNNGEKTFTTVDTFRFNCIL